MRLRAPVLMLVLLTSCAPEAEVRSLSVAKYEDKVAGFWLGQLIGNIYGLSHEFQYLDEPGPDAFPYGFGAALDRAIEVDGAFSDDDTDLEYMYLLEMEEHGIEPTYAQLRDAWMYHIRDRIWAANRVSLTLMHHGYYPPATGAKENNPRWFEIDPQLINEIWAVTAPGMTRYAVDKTAWAARITNDDFGIEPALFYAAMISEAFFESDVRALMDVGKDALPENGRFRGVVEEMEVLYAAHPDDWQAARAVLAERYGGRQPYNEYGWEPIDATLNGAAAVLALLYGEGDIQRTLDLACAMGWDADNQAATLTGLMGIIHGADALPLELLYPVEGWEKPFNDRYVNVSRYDLPDASIQDQIERLVTQGKAVVAQVGGAVIRMDGEEMLLMDRLEPFFAPKEVLPPPAQFLTIGDSVDIDFYSTHDEVSLASSLPEGWYREGSRVAGLAAEAGRFEIAMSAGSDTASVVIHILPRNRAPEASGILHHTSRQDLSVLRDGSRLAPAFYSSTADAPAKHWYGYEWEEPVDVSAVTFTVGFPREEWGWFLDPVFEYRTTAGQWTAVSGLQLSPDMPAGTTKYLQPGLVTYLASFDPVRTTALRLIGWAGGHPVDAPPEYGTTLTELTIH